MPQKNQLYKKQTSHLLVDLYLPPQRSIYYSILKNKEMRVYVFCLIINAFLKLLQYIITWPMRQYRTDLSLVSLLGLP
jgi:hypothetical protein